MLKSKKVSRIISALLVVMLVASLGITTVSAKNNDDEAFTFTFNATTPMSWTKSRAKEDTSSLYAKMTDMGGAYYVTCYGAGAKAKIFREAVELHCRRLITRQRDMIPIM